MKRVFISGTGNVGRNLIRLIQQYNTGVRITGLENRRGMISGDHLTNNDVDNFLKNPEKFGKNRERAEYDIFVDLRTASRDGRMELESYISEFQKGKNVVTANKSGLANYWPEIFQSCENENGHILYEATVAGGLPIFSTLRASCGYFKVRSFRGIVNLTSNYIIKKVNSGVPLKDAEEEAIRLGIAETDMSDDLTGKDSARKAVIVCNSLFGKKFRLSDFKYGGLNLNKIEQNSMLLVSINDDGEFKAQSDIQILEENDPFLKMAPTAMAAEIGFYGRANLTLIEEFDGPLETASAVLSDIINI